MRGSWRPNRTATYWPPLLWPSAFLSRSPGLLNWGPGAQPLWVLVTSTASYLQLIWSPTRLIPNSSDPQLISREPEGSLCCVLAFSTASYPQLVWSPTDLISNCNCSIGGLRAHSTGCCLLYCILSPTHLISNFEFPCALSYIIVQRPLSSCGRHNFALIQPVHGQGYNILIFLDRMQLLFTQVLFTNPSARAGYDTRSIF